MGRVFVFFIVLVSFQMLYADDSTSNEALRRTQELLADKAQRNAIIANDPKAASVDKNVKNLMGENSEDLYQSSAADFLPYILQQSGGDPVKAQELLSNPEQFLANLPPDLKAKVSALADKSTAKQKNP